MVGRGQNQGFHILDEFVCEAIPSPSVTPANPASQGRNEGMSVVEEVVFDAAPAAKPADKESDRAKRVVGISDVARPLHTSWSDLFTGAAAAALFSGFVGGVLKAVGAVAAVQQGRSAEKACRLCGRPDPAYSLQCCHSPTCATCFSRMLTPSRADGVGFRCAICGHVHTEAAPV